MRRDRPLDRGIVHDIADVDGEAQLQHGKSEEGQNGADQHELDGGGAFVIEQWMPVGHRSEPADAVDRLREHTVSQKIVHDLQRFGVTNEERDRVV